MGLPENGNLNCPITKDVTQTYHCEQITYRIPVFIANRAHRFRVGYGEQKWRVIAFYIALSVHSFDITSFDTSFQI